MQPRHLVLLLWLAVPPHDVSDSRLHPALYFLSFITSHSTPHKQIKMASGGCACKYIRYTTSCPPVALVNCHCTECRKQAGAPYQAWIRFPVASIEWEKKPTVWQSSESASRGFCPRCGSTLTMTLDKDPTNLAVAAGSVDDEVSTVVPFPSSHIFLREKAPWFELPDDGTTRWAKWEE